MFFYVKVQIATGKTSFESKLTLIKILFEIRKDQKGGSETKKEGGKKVDHISHCANVPRLRQQSTSRYWRAKTPMQSSKAHTL